MTIWGIMDTDTNSQKLCISLKGTEIFNNISQYIQQNAFLISYDFDDTLIGAFEFIDKYFIVHINKSLSDPQKEMVLLHELLHGKQVISGILMRDFKKDVEDRELVKYYKEIQNIILDAPIHKQLSDYGYDLSLISKRDCDSLFAFYLGKGLTLKPITILHKTVPLSAASLCYIHSKESYDKLIQIIYKKDEKLYDTIIKLNSFIVRFVNNEITFIECFENVVDCLGN